MTTHSGTYASGDFDDELVAWLEDVKLGQRDDVAELDAYADLWLANGDAKAIKDPNSPAAAEAHAKIDAVLDRIVGL